MKTKLAAFIACTVALTAADSFARSPMLGSCTLTKEQVKKARSQVKNKFPQVKELHATRSCECYEECDIRLVRFAPFEVPVPDKRIVFRVTVATSISDGDYAMLEEERVDYEALAARIRRLPVTKELTDTDLLCDGVSEYGSFKLTCDKTGKNARADGSFNRVLSGRVDSSGKLRL